MKRIVLLEIDHNTFQFVVTLPFSINSPCDEFYESDQQTYKNKIHQASEWCKQQFENEYKSWNLIDNSVFVFQNDQDALAFKMAWS